MDPTIQYDWSPPQYEVSHPPSPWSSMQAVNDENPTENFVRTAKWCPDGSTFLAQYENRTFQFFDTPTHDSLASSKASPSLVLPQPSPILDFIWYPTASPMNPAAFCFVASVRECPVKLLDAADGRLRASYRIVDHRERQIAPHSLAFNLTAERLYCGFEDAIEVFDVNRPGEGTRLSTTPSKKSKDGLKGIVSALAFVPSQGSDIYAAGSLSPTHSNIAMFSETQGAEPIMFASGGPPSGVTQIHFNPTQPHIMYASFRRHGAIYSWDLRSNVDTPLRIYNFRDISGRTNQKLRFDVDLGGRWLASGDQHGKISMFDLQLPAESAETEAEEVFPTLEFDAHGDAVGSVAFHPFQSILLSTSGSRHFHPDEESASDSSDSGSDTDSEPVQELETTSTPRVRIIRRKSRPQPVTLESTIKTWSFTGPATLQPELEGQP